MTIGTTVGLKEHMRKLRAYGDGAESGSMQIMMVIGEQVRQTAMDSIRQGTVRGRGHVPSKPGEPPKGDTGRLELSINVYPRKSEKGVVVIAEAPHAAAMEFGTRTIAPRPYMRPALQKHKARFVSAIAAMASGLTGVRVLRNSNAAVDAANQITGR